MRTSRASLAFVASAIALLCIHAVRGLSWAMAALGTASGQQKRAARVHIYFEAFSCVLGRTMAYSLHFCMVAVRLVSGQAWL